MKSSGIQCPGKGGSFLNDTVNRADNSLNGELTTNRKLQVTEYEEFGKGVSRYWENLQSKSSATPSGNFRRRLELMH